MDKMLQRMAKLRTLVGSPEKTSRKSREEQRQAPHPIPKGMEGATCPITGFAGFASEEIERTAASKAAREALEADPDIALERIEKAPQARSLQLARLSRRAEVSAIPATPARFVPLNVIGRTHHANEETLRLVREVGGLPTLRRFTTLFYKKSFADSHIDQFIHSHKDPHAERFAFWIAEKFGDGTPWTNERATRKPTMLRIEGHVERVSFDRSSAHVAAWFSPKRKPHLQGQHFNVEDARNWMRLHFWAAREAGLFEPQHAAFMDYYMRFIGHFVRVYASEAPAFTRESARWSANPANIEKYLASGNAMTDIIGVGARAALADLPAEERRSLWPYSS